MNTRFLPNSAGRALGIAAAFAAIHAVSPGQVISGSGSFIPNADPFTANAFGGSSLLTSDPIISNIVFTGIPNHPVQITGIELIFDPASSVFLGLPPGTNAQAGSAAIANAIALTLNAPAVTQSPFAGVGLPAGDLPTNVSLIPGVGVGNPAGEVPQTNGAVSNINPVTLNSGGLDTGAALLPFLGNTVTINGDTVQQAANGFGGGLLTTGFPGGLLDPNVGNNNFNPHFTVISAAESNAILAYLQANGTDGRTIGVGLADYAAGITQGFTLNSGIGGPTQVTVDFFFSEVRVPFSPVQWLGIGAILLMAAAKVGFKRLPGLVGLC